MSEVTVIIPVHGRWDLTAQLLKDIRAQTAAITHIILVDNASSDETVPNAAKLGVEVIAMGENSGFARAVNRGLASVHTEFVLIVNNDVRLPADWLERLLFLCEIGAWFAAGRLLSGSRTGEIDGTFDLISRGGCAWRAGHGTAASPPTDNVSTMDFPSFTAGLFRTSLFNRIGPLEERFGSYLEDVDFGLRCVKAGLWGMYDPTVSGIHIGSATLGEWHPSTARQIARNQIWLVARHFPSVSWAVVVSQCLFVALAFSRSAGWAALQGVFEGFRSFGTMRTAGPYLKADFLRRHEREIASGQGNPPRDRFWQLYFKLT